MRRREADMSSSKDAKDNPKPESELMRRRSFLAGAGVATVGAALWCVFGRNAIRAEAAGAAKMVTIVGFKDNGTRTTKESVARVVKTDDEWRKQLSPAAFEVTRRAATERPFTGDLLNVHEKGVFRCICCDNALYDSSTKFESGTGWPSFYQPIAKENILESVDMSLGMTRTA